MDDAPPPLNLRMKPEIHLIPTPTPGRLAIMPRPRGGEWLEKEVHAWRSAGLDVVVSLLTPGEVTDLDLAAEKRLCETHGLHFVSFPIEDRSIPPSREAVEKLAADLASRMAQGRNIAIHCRQGLGRAPLIAIAVLIHTGIDLVEATRRVSEARGCPVPETREQEQWIARFAENTPMLTAK